MLPEFLSSPFMFNRALQQFSGNSGEPFTLEVTNSAPVQKSFYLSPGLLYTPGAEKAGQLKTGAFAAIGEKTTGPFSLTASTPNSIPIEQFLAYIQQNPTYVYKVESTSTNGAAQAAGVITTQQQGMVVNDKPVIDPIRKYMDGNQFHLGFQSYGKPRFFSATDVVTMPVAANSTLTLNIYPQASVNPRVELTNSLQAAKKWGEGLMLASAQKVNTISPFKKKKNMLPWLLLAAVALLVIWRTAR